MYRVGQKPKQRKKWPIWVAVLLILLAFAIGAAWLYRQISNPTTTLEQADAVTTTVAAVDERREVFQTPEFSIELPFDWKLLPRTPGPYNLYRFQGGGANTNTKIIEVYIDTIPKQFAVNRVAAVEANGTQLAVKGPASDNCKEFTKGELRATAGGTLAKWQGIDFLCDLNNYERNVVGTSSLGAINSVQLTSLSGAKRNVFFTYTDQALDYNFDSFFNALTTFRLK